jgi:hypothetical protein
MKVLILTVGTTREPLEVALSEHAPEGVVFLASQASHPVAAELLRDYGASFRHHTLLLEDAESLVSQSAHYCTPTPHQDEGLGLFSTSPTIPKGRA